MPTSPRASSGRILLALLVVAAVAAIAVLFVALDPLGGGDGVERSAGENALGELRTEGPETDAPGEGVTAGGLAGRYDESELGAVRVRLLDAIQRDTLPGQALRLVSRLGTTHEATTGADGVALFGRIAPGRGYLLDIAAEAYAAVTVQGITVRPGETTDLGDIVLGENVILRGRVLDTRGLALAGASVAVYTPSEDFLSEGFLFGMVDRATNFPDPVDRATSDDDGWFTLTALPDGTYRLEVRHAGFATRTEDDVVVSRNRPARDMTIVLGEGATATGTVRDDVGKPVAGARVVALKDAGGRFFGRGGTTVERDMAFTDASGRYVMDTLSQGQNYRFGVIAEGYAPLFEMNAEEIRGRHHEKDFVLPPGGAIAGRVVTASDGTPVADAEVLVAVGRMPWGPGGRGGDTEQRAATGRTRTDKEGRFRIESLLPGPVLSAQVKADGFVPYATAMWGGEGWGEVTAGGELQVNVELEQGGAIEGKVFDRQTKEPIAEAEVTVIPRGQAWRIFMSGAPSTTTDASGAYRLVGVEPGSYGVVAVASGYAPSDPGADDTEVTVAEAGSTAKLDVGLGRSGTIVGKVLDSQGEPIAGARVRSRMAPPVRSEGRGGRGGRGGGMQRFRSFLPGGSGAALTDQEGRYHLDDVAAGERWILSADADDFVRIESEPVSVGAGETKEVDLVLSGGGTLEGRVVDDQGRFVEGARVQVGSLPEDVASQGRLSAWNVDRYLDPRVFFTDADGRFRATNLEPGRAVVKAEMEGFVTQYKRNVVIRPDETIENYAIAMLRGDVMEGVVKGPDGRPVEGAMVAVTSAVNPGEEEEGDAESDTIEPRLSGRSDADGRFRIENVPPGTWSVVVWFAPGYQGWANGQNANAIRRGISSAAKDVEFRLEAQPQGQNPFGPGRGGRGGGNR